MLFARAPMASPYYIAAPRYLATSAGVRLLHELCHGLNSMGHDAYVAIYPFARGDGDVSLDLRTPVLTPEIIAHHRAHGRRPIVLYPETMPPTALPGGVRVAYILCEPGLLGGPDSFPDAHYILTYARSLNHTLPHVDGTLYIPTVDPAYFSPPATPVTRDLVLAYAGKYVDLHGQTLPPHLLQSARVITRNKPGSPSRAELRALFQRARALYVFENTALATEAVLCGCPVVCMKNPYFQGLLAESEQGSLGMTWTDSPASIEQARREVASFRAAYLAALARIPADMQRFVDDTQALAARVTDIAPVRLPGGRLIRCFDWWARRGRMVALSIEDAGFWRTAYYVARGLLRKLRRRT